MEKKSSKKKFDLSADLIDVKRQDPKTELVLEAPVSIGRKPIPSLNNKTKLTLSVPSEFVPEYKTWCIKNNTTMSNAILEGFKLLKQKYGY